MRDLLTRRVLLFGGKGGVGKTTCAAAMAVAASRTGRRVLLVSTDPAHSTSDILGVALGPDPRDVAPGLRALELDAEHEASRFLAQVRTQVASLFSPAVLRHVAPQFELAASMPGVVDVAVFDRMAELMLAEDDQVDLLVFDTAPTGHTLRLLQMPESLAVWVGALAARRRDLVRQQGEWRGDAPGQDARPDPVLAALERRESTLRQVRALLTDTSRAAVVLVLVPERLPIEETARAVSALDAAGIPVGALIVNRVLPDGLSGEFYRARYAQEQIYRREIADRFGDRIRATVPQHDVDINRFSDLVRVAESLVHP